MAPETAHPSSLAEHTLCRHSPEVGAVCGQAARTVLCGGRAMKRTSLPLRRREFIAGLGSAAAWPGAAPAQQAASPVIGFLSGRSPTDSMANVAAFNRGLNQTGYSDGQNVEIDFRWALGHYDQLPALAADLIRRRVTVIVATGGGVTSAQAAKSATTTVPIVFVAGTDPVAFGLAASLNKPGGNLTGISFLAGALMAKNL